MTTTRNLEIAPPNKPSDNSSKAPGDGVEPLSVKFPTTTEERDSWKTDLASMHASNKGTADSVLPPFSLTLNERSTQPAGVDDKTDRPAKTGRGGDGTPSGLSNSVLDQLGKLQEAERGLGDEKGGSADHSDEDKKADTGRAAHGEANVHSHEFHAEVAQKNDELEDEHLTERISSKFGDSLVALTPSSDDSDLMVRALSGDVVAPHQVSIFELKVRKETDGRVVLTAPAGDKGRAQDVAVVQDHGKPVSAMELGKYLRPDGTILIGERGQVLRPGEELEAKSFTKTDGKTGSDFESTEKSLVNENKDQELIAMTALDVIDGRNASILIPESDLIAASDLTAESDLSYSRNNPLNMNPMNLDPLDPEMHRTKIAKDLNFESRLQNNNASDQIRSLEVASAQSDTPEHRSIKTRLGETFRSIALRNLNDVKKWPLIAELNNYSVSANDKGEPIAVLQKGTTLLLPNASEIEDFQARQVALRCLPSSALAPAPV